MIITPTLIEAVASGIAIVSMIWKMGAWSNKVDINTKATNKLTNSFDTFTEKVTGTLADHEVRIQINEHDISHLRSQVEKK